MQNGKVTQLNMPGIIPFHFQIKYTETNQKDHWHEIDLHSHNEFELYVNLSGDVSFLVETSIYPLSRGDVIIARPSERHHCIYRSDKPHRLFWILFDCQKNHALWDFLQPGCCENFISPQGELKEELLELCRRLHGEELSCEETLYSFFRIFAILKQSRNKHLSSTATLPQDLNNIIDYIDANIHEPLTVSEIAKRFYTSQSTLERRFKQILNITPSEFIRRKKVILAAQMLRSGESVLQTGINLGYNDASYFVQLFKKYYRHTPHEYKHTGKL